MKERPPNTTSGKESFFRKKEEKEHDAELSEI